MSGCHPASPITRWQSFLPQVEGTGRDATPWGLLMFPHPLPARVGDQEKIVWRMTGTGMLTLARSARTASTTVWPGVRTLTRAATGIGREMSGARAMSFTTPGCWDLRAIRGDAIADAWIQVVTR